MEDSSYEIKEVATSVPVFLLKLVSMLNDSDNHEFVDWTQAGTSFIVKDQVQFSKIVLPKYFKHNKFASFVRQLNMYGFRKITSLTQTGLTPDRDEVEFYHYLFVRNQDHLLPQIKRKVNKPDAVSRNSEDVSKVLESVQEMRSFQDIITHRLSGMKQENEELWREVMSLRQKHAHQQKVVNKLIQFLVNLVHQTGMGVKRRRPLMIDDGTSDSPPLDKLAKPMIYVEESSARPVMDKSPQPIVSFPTSNEEDNERTGDSSGPYITEVSSIGNIAPTISAGEMKSQTAPTNRGTPEIQHSDTVWLPEELTTSNQLSNNYNSTAIQPLTQLDAISMPQIAQSSVHRRPDQITPCYPNDGTVSLGDLTSDVNKVQSNIDSLQDSLFNNSDIGLDNVLFQELFGAYPDLELPENVQLPKESLKGSEVILHTRQDQHVDDDLVDADFSDVTNYL